MHSKNVKLVLHFLRRFTKHENFDVNNLKYIQNGELLSFWLKNLTVLNKDSKKIALKIEKSINELVNKFKDSDNKD